MYCRELGVAVTSFSREEVIFYHTKNLSLQIKMQTKYMENYLLLQEFNVLEILYSSQHEDKFN